MHDSGVLDDICQFVLKAVWCCFGSITRAPGCAGLVDKTPRPLPNCFRFVALVVSSIVHQSCINRQVMEMQKRIYDKAPGFPDTFLVV